VDDSEPHQLLHSGRGYRISGVYPPDLSDVCKWHFKLYFKDHRFF